MYIEGEDYEVKGGNCDNETCTIQTLFPGGKTSATFDVKIKPDERLESNESFNVSIHPLSLPHCVVLGDITTAEVIILDNDGKVTLYSLHVYIFAWVLLPYSI